MKKKFSILFSSIFLASFLTLGVVSCGDSKPSENDNTQETDKEKEITNIEAARNLENESEVTIKGTVAKIFYTANMTKSGYLLIDDTGSIIVKDENASSLTEGSLIQLTGKLNKNEETHDFSITATSIDSKDETVHEIDGSKATELSVSECKAYNTGDISIIGNFYKGLVKITSKSGTDSEDPSKSWTSYRFEAPSNDKDYLQVYSNNSGEDFEYLDEYNGTTQFVYYTVINYKKNRDTFYPRVLPIHVGFLDSDALEDKNVPNYLMDKFIAPQFKAIYDFDPETELLTKVSDPERGITEATVTYTSKNESVATITEREGKTYLNIIAQGETGITVKVTYKDFHTSTRDYNFTSMIIEGALNTKTIKEALDAPYCDEGDDPDKETMINLKGTIYASGDSLRNTFYVGDKTGVILIDAEAIKNDIEALHIGDLIRVEGWKRRFGEGNGRFGTTLVEANIIQVVTKTTLNPNEVVLDKTSYITNKTLEDIEEFVIDPTVDHTKEIYTIKAKLIGNKITFVPRENIKCEIDVYTGDISKLNWAKSDEEITMDIAFININDKTYYSCAILAVYNADGTVKRNTANFQ